MPNNIIGEAFLAISPESAGFASKLKAQLAGVGATGAGVAIGALITAAVVESGIQFQRVTQQIQQETGQTGEVLKGLAETVKSVFTDVPSSLKDTTSAIDELTRRGVPLGTLLGTLSKQELDLARITGSDLATTVDTTTALFAKFNIPIAQQSRELDVLFKAQQQSGKGLSELVQPLLGGAAALQVFGFSLDKSAALVANLEKAGVSVAPALQALRLAFAKLAQEGKDPQTELARLFKELQAGTNPAGALSDAFSLLGRRSGLELVQAVKQGRFSTADLLKLITDGKGGILATSDATLSLGNRFTELRHKIEAGIEPLGENLVKAISAVVNDVGPGVQHFVTSVSGLVSALLPTLLPIAVGLKGAFSAIGPILNDTATGLDAIAAAVHLATGGTSAGLVALGAVAAGAAVAFTGLGSALVTFGLELAAFVESNPELIAITASVIAIGAVLNHFKSSAGDAGKAIKAEADSFGDASGIFNASATTTVAALNAYIQAQEKAGKAGDLPEVLGAAGSNLRQFTTAVSGGSAAWEDYGHKVLVALKAAGNGPAEIARAAHALVDQRTALIATVQLEISRAKAAGLVTSAQVGQIQVQDTLRDGTINYGKALEDVNRLANRQAVTVAATAAATDASNIAAFKATSTYRDLVAQLASGKISEDQFNQTVQDTADVSDKAAKAIGDGLVAAINSFVSTALGALPTVSGAIDKFGSDITAAQSAVTSALASQASDVASAQKAVGSAFKSSADSVLSAQQSLSDAITGRDLNVANATNAFALASALRDKGVIDAQRRLVEATTKNNQRIADAQANLAKVTRQHADEVAAAIAKRDRALSPQAFIDNLNKGTTSTISFQANLQKLISEGFTPLAAELAKKGPEAGGALAAGLASNPVLAKAAEQGAEIAQASAKAYEAFIRAHFNPVRDDGTELGKQLIDGIILGIEGRTPNLSKAVDKISRHVVSVMRDNFRVESPSKVTRDIGHQFGEGLALGIDEMGARVRSAADGLSGAALAGLRRFEQSQRPALERSGLRIPGQTGFDRADAQAGVFAGAHISFPDQTDPVHLAGELAWRWNHQ